MRIQSAGQDIDAFAIDAAFHPAAAVLLAVDVDEIELAVEPVHETPRQRFHEMIVGEDLHVLRKIRVIDAHGAQVQHLGGHQSRDADGARR